MISFPSAKINLGLSIVGKRPDGYHDLETIMLPIPLCDMLEVIENQSDSLRLFPSGLSIPGIGTDNLVERSYRELKKEFRLPGLDVYLHKLIPAGAGLGGGSADAAFFIRELNAAFSLGMTIDTMKGVAGIIGSDCPFFIENKAMFASGRGQDLVPVDIPVAGDWILLAWPGIHVSTREAYAACSPQRSTFDLRGLAGIPKAEWKNLVRNDFEKPVFEQFPAIGQLKDHLYQSGAYYASMSGSGSAVYGLFSSSEPSLDPPFTEPFTWKFRLPEVLNRIREKKA